MKNIKKIELEKFLHAINCATGDLLIACMVGISLFTMIKLLGIEHESAGIIMFGMTYFAIWLTKYYNRK